MFTSNRRNEEDFVLYITSNDGNTINNISSGGTVHKECTLRVCRVGVVVLSSGIELISLTILLNSFIFHLF